jgi:hypothetical protein
MANLAKDPKKREQDARALGHVIIDAAKQSGLSAEDISRPMLRRAPNAMQLPPTERTKQLDLTPELADRLSPSSDRSSDRTRISQPPSQPPSGHDRVSSPAISSSPSQPVARAYNGHERPLTAATAKWEPPTEFQARLADAVGATRDRPSGIIPASPSSRPMTAVPQAAPSRPRSPSGVDETMDDVSFDPPPNERVDRGAATIATPPPAFPETSSKRGRTRATPTEGAEQSTPRTMPGDPDDTRPPTTHYVPPAAGVSAPTPAARRAESSRPQPVSDAPPPLASHAPRSTRRSSSVDVDEPRSSRGLAFVVLCFVLGACLAAGWAWKMGKLGGTAEVDDEAYVTRASDALYKHRFVAPAGENVRDITDEGLKKWPNDRRLLDVRMRAASELLTQATAQRSAGDIVEALRLARGAHDLDPNDASAKRLVDQYEAELAAFTTPTAPPLGKPPVVPSGKPVAPATVPSPAPAASAAPAYKLILEANVVTPRLGQTVELTARVAPTKGNFDSATFTITGPGLGGGATMPAQSPAPGVFKASYAFLEAGRFEVTFTTQADGKPLKAVRSITAGEAPAPPPTPKLPDPGPKPTPAGPAPTGSVKWM